MNQLLDRETAMKWTTSFAEAARNESVCGADRFAGLPRTVVKLRERTFSRACRELTDARLTVKEKPPRFCAAAYVSLVFHCDVRRQSELSASS